MTFWVYENWRAHGHRATVHRSQCGHCNGGLGRSGEPVTPNGRWHGPFTSFDDAVGGAQATGAVVHGCRSCAPSASRGSSPSGQRSISDPSPRVRRSNPPGLPGWPVPYGDLLALGFLPFDLQPDPRDAGLPSSGGRRWTTLGQVPDSSGVYAFTVDDGGVPHVAYVGLTTNLWMVTKGRLPQGGARPGQRYGGRPEYIGQTRLRVNILVCEQQDLGRRVRHWLRPLPPRT